MGSLRPEGFGWVRLGLVAAVIASCLVLSAGGAAPSAGLASSWVGKLVGSNAFIAIASNGTEVLACACDGKTIAQWFNRQTGVNRLDLVAGRLDLEAKSPGLQARLSQNAAAGKVVFVGGRSSDFPANRVSGDAGLYRLEETIDNERWLSGWAVLNDGQLRGARENPSTGALQSLTAISPEARLISPVLARY